MPKGLSERLGQAHNTAVSVHDEMVSEIRSSTRINPHLGSRIYAAAHEFAALANQADAQIIVNKFLRRTLSDAVSAFTNGVSTEDMGVSIYVQYFNPQEGGNNQSCIVFDFYDPADRNKPPTTFTAYAEDASADSGQQIGLGWKANQLETLYDMRDATGYSDFTTLPSHVMHAIVDFADTYPLMPQSDSFIYYILSLREIIPIREREELAIKLAAAAAARAEQSTEREVVESSLISPGEPASDLQALDATAPQEEPEQIQTPLIEPSGEPLEDQPLQTEQIEIEDEAIMPRVIPAVLGPEAFAGFDQTTRLVDFLHESDDPQNVLLAQAGLKQYPRGLEGDELASIQRTGVAIRVLDYGMNNLTLQQKYTILLADTWQRIINFTGIKGKIIGYVANSGDERYAAVSQILPVTTEVSRLFERIQPTFRRRVSNFTNVIRLAQRIDATTQKPFVGKGFTEVEFMEWVRATLQKHPTWMNRELADKIPAELKIPGRSLKLYIDDSIPAALTRLRKLGPNIVPEAGRQRRRRDALLDALAKARQRPGGRLRRISDLARDTGIPVGTQGNYIRLLKERGTIENRHGGPREPSVEEQGVLNRIGTEIERIERESREKGQILRWDLGDIPYRTLARNLGLRIGTITHAIHDFREYLPYHDAEGKQTLLPLIGPADTKRRIVDYLRGKDIELIRRMSRKDLLTLAQTEFSSQITRVKLYDAIDVIERELHANLIERRILRTLTKRPALAWERAVRNYVPEHYLVGVLHNGQNPLLAYGSIEQIIQALREHNEALLIHGPREIERLIKETQTASSTTIGLASNKSLIFILSPANCEITLGKDGLISIKRRGTDIKLTRSSAEIEQLVNEALGSVRSKETAASIVTRVMNERNASK